MKEQKGGSIINVASVNAFKPEPNTGVYSISKGAVVVATKAMALEWGIYNIRVNAVAPGQVHTRLGDSRFALVPNYEQQLVSKTPLGRIASTSEIVGAIIYLASDVSSFTTGSTIIVDGGFLLS
jgi:NAD(P)-dependent dehydrogenase (short-subunit alcohol dehydrogenase family)